jgi:hypothetical protein
MASAFQLSIETAEFFFKILNEESLSSAFNADVLITTFEQIEILGHTLLIILSVILLLAMFAIIIISKSNNKLI